MCFHQLLLHEWAWQLSVMFKRVTHTISGVVVLQPCPQVRPCSLEDVKDHYVGSRSTEAELDQTEEKWLNQKSKIQQLITMHVLECT